MTGIGAIVEKNGLKPHIANVVEITEFSSETIANNRCTTNAWLFEFINKTNRTCRISGKPASEHDVFRRISYFYSSDHSYTWHFIQRLFSQFGNKTSGFFLRPIH